MEHKWVHSSVYSSIPPNAVLGGNDTDGATIYVGRTYHNGDTLVASVMPCKQLAFVTWRGEAIPKDHFEMLCGTNLVWEHCYHHVIPDNAVLCGSTALDQPVYIGRGHYDGSLTVGKISSVHRALFIPFKGAERRLETYEVLVAEKSAAGWNVDSPPPPPLLVAEKKTVCSLIESMRPLPPYPQTPPTPTVYDPPPPYVPVPPPNAVPVLPTLATPYPPPPLPNAVPVLPTLAAPYPPPPPPPPSPPPCKSGYLGLPDPYPPPQKTPAINYQPLPQKTPAFSYQPPPPPPAPPSPHYSSPAATYQPTPQYSTPASTYQPPPPPQYSGYATPAATYRPAQQDTWVAATPSYTPRNAVHAGHDSDLSTILVSRAFHDGHLIPGKAVPCRGCAYVSYAGQEIPKSHYEVLIGEGYHWVPAHDGNIAPGAVEAGHTVGGEPLFVGRAHFCGSLTPGKIQRSHHCLYIAYGGAEQRISNYEVLVRRADYYRADAMKLCY